eukprot:3363651-Rhodomonas_salina.1
MEAVVYEFGTLRQCSPKDMRPTRCGRTREPGPARNHRQKQRLLSTIRPRNAPLQYHSSQECAFSVPFVPGKRLLAIDCAAYLAVVAHAEEQVPECHVDCG